MTTTNLGYELTCDGCGTVWERKPWVRANGSTYEPNYEQARGVRDRAHADGWTSTTYMSVDGHWQTVPFRRGDPHLPRRNNGLLDVCPDCQPDWEPPYTQTAARELARRQVAEAITEGTTAALMRRVEEMAAEVVQLKDRMRTTGGDSGGR